MTAFLAWLAVDSRKATQLYFASDSRRSYDNGDYFDDCTKLFVSEKSPDIFALLGQDITFPMKALPNVCVEIDRGDIPPGRATSLHGRTDWVFERLQHLKLALPGGSDFTVFHGSRSLWGDRAVFGLSQYRFESQGERWVREDIDLSGRKSHAVNFDGSGGVLVSHGVQERTAAMGSVSRAYFGGFTAALRDGLDRRSGGAPQLVGLGSVGNGRHYGIVTASGPVFMGRPTAPSAVPAGTQWRDENLEPVDEFGTSTRNRRRKVLR